VMGQALIRALSAELSSALSQPARSPEALEGNNDFRYLTSIKAMLSPAVSPRVTLLPGNLGFLGTKAELSACDVLLAARMHCGINAVLEAVPTIFIAYSQKGYGMARYVYGHTDWVLPLIRDFTSSNVLDRVKAMLRDRATVRKYLQLRSSEIRADTRSAIEALDRILA